MTTNERNELKKALEEHVFKLNEGALAWMRAAEEGEFRGAAIYDDTDIYYAIEYYDVRSTEDWDALRAWEEYADVYKDVNGIKPRWTTWKDNTAEEWEEEIKAL